MKQAILGFGLALGVAIALAGAACSPQSVTGGVSTVCADIAKLPASVTAALDAQPATSQLGVLWADAKAGCSLAAPALGVHPEWTALVWGMVKALAPVVVPWLIGLL